MSELDQAIITLYNTFRTYRLKSKIDGCPCCQLESSEKMLHARPLNELTWVDFNVYPFKAMTTFGDENDFKHFLPRILELYATHYNGTPYGIDVIFSKLSMAYWSMSAKEIEAIEHFVSAWHKVLVAKGQDWRRDWDLEPEEKFWILENFEQALRKFRMETESA